MLHPLRLGLAGALAGSFLLAGVMATPAGAHGSKPTDSDLAVYNANTEPVSTISVQVTVPTYTCKKADQVALYTNTFDEDGPGEFPFSGPSMDLACGKKSVPVVESSLEVAGTTTFPTITIVPGNVVQMNVSCGGTGTVVSLDDTSTGHSVQATSAAASDCNGVFMGAIGVLKGAGPKLCPLPGFGSADFSDALINGSSLGSFSPTATNYYEGKKNQMTVGPVTDGGTDFAITKVA
jgi:hypothetical protein